MTTSSFRLWPCFAAGVLALPLAPGGALHAAVPISAENVSLREGSFDLGWRFYRGALTGAEAVNYDDGTWRSLNVPHDWSIEDLPNADPNLDTANTSNPSLFANYAQNTVPAGVATLVGPFDVTNSASGAATGYTVGGEGWYRKHFALPGLASGQHVELRFDGVYQNADFYLNGQRLGFHPYGYTTFALDLTPYLNANGAENVLAVHVNNTGKNSRFYSGSGILRHTWLTTTGPVRVATNGVQITTPAVSNAQATVHAKVAVTDQEAMTAAGRNVQLRVTLLDARGNLVATNTTGPQSLTPLQTLSFETDLAVTNPALWSPASPSLYQARVEVLGAGANGSQVLDGTTTTFGVRSIVMNGTVGFLLNGQPVKMRGVCIHSDLGALGNATNDRAEERRVEILKAAGYNAIRTSHQPPAPALLAACDRLGMLVYEEAFDMWDAAKNPDDYHLYFPTYGVADLQSMVERDRNHPSVVMWSVGNEIYDFANGIPYQDHDPAETQVLADAVRAKDTTRPTTQGGFAAGLIAPTYAQTAASTIWNAVELGDIHYQDDYTPAHVSHMDRAMLQSESFPSTTDLDWALVANNAYVVGDFVWTGWDYIGEATLAPPVLDRQGTPLYNSSTGLTGLAMGTGLNFPWYGAFCGDIDLIGTRKPQLSWRQVVWGDNPVEMMVERPVAPAGMKQAAACWGYFDELASWTWPGVSLGTAMKVRVYTSGDAVSLYLGGTLVGTNTLTSTDRMQTTFSVPYAPGQLTAVASRLGAEIGRRSFSTVGAPACLRLVSDRTSLTTDQNSLAHVRVEVIDANNNLVPDAVTKVSFQVGSHARLLGVASGNPHNADSFKLPRRYTWHGQALAILGSDGTAGPLTLTATAPGLCPASVILPVASSVVSRKVHGSAGTFDLPLNLTGTPAVECRRPDGSGGYQLVFSFDRALSFAGVATVAAGNATVASTVLGPQANQVSVNLSNVPDAQHLIVSLSSVLDGTGAVVGAISAPVDILVGDTGANGTVNAADVAQTKAQSGLAATASNYREDVNEDGVVNAADVALVKSRSGNALPPANP